MTYPLQGKHPPIALTIAGSDSSGGAGIQADLRTFSAYRAHGLSVITAITAQNTHAVLAVHRIPVRYLSAQLEALFNDFSITSVKIGMLGNANTVLTVAQCLRKWKVRQVVLDPVMIASSGARLLDRRALSALRELIPMAEVFTPNLPEAEVLLGRSAAGKKQDRRKIAQQLLELGCRSVLLKGGHGDTPQLEDHYLDARQHVIFRHSKLPIEIHGTGCTLAAAVAAGLAMRWSRIKAIREAVRYVQVGLCDAYRPGKSAVYVLGNHVSKHTA